jgi:o-succinylbenzoate synthase
MTPRLELRRSEQHLEAPLVNAGAAWDRRMLTCVLLHEQDGGGARVSGCGEASPLPGYSPDTDTDVERAIGALDGSQLAALAAASSAADVLASVAALLPEAPPAARFGLETVLLDRLARASGQPLWRLLAALAGTGSAPREVALCGLVPSAEPAAAARVVEAHLKAGVRVFKLKIGPERLSASQEATLEALRGRFGRAVALRLDANGSLNRSELASTLQRLARFEPELLEEPVADLEPRDLVDSPCPLALDESLQELSEAERERRIESLRPGILVLKPTCLGGFGSCLRLAALARRLGIDTIVSHALEGPIGWSACAHLALALGSPRAAGLWPLRHQRCPSPGVADGRLLAPAAPGLGASF